MTYSVGIIGTGFGTKVHLPALQAHEDFEVKIIAGRNPSKTEKIAAEAGIKGTTNWREILNQDVDLITISTPPFLHYEMAMEVLQAGKHLLLEKPTTHSALQAQQLVSTSLNHNLVGMMCHEFRWLPHRNYLTHLVSEENIIGDLQEIHYNSYQSFAALSDNPKFGWLWDSRFEGGMLGALGSHLIDQIRATTQREFLTVSGYTTTRTQIRQDYHGEMQKVTADDGFGLFFEMDNDVRGVLTASATVSPALGSKFILSGDKGTVYNENDKIYFGEIGGSFEEVEIPSEFQIDTALQEKDRRIPPFLKLLDQVKLSLDDGKSLTPSLTDGWRNQLVVDAVRQSQATGQKISIKR